MLLLLVSLLLFVGGRADDAEHGLPSLSISDVTVAEGDVGNVSATFRLRLSRPRAKTLIVRFRTANGSARAGNDYVARSGTITFKPGQRTRIIAVEVLADDVAEADETFFVVLRGVRTARVTRSRGTATIRRNDLPAPFTLTAAMDGEQVVGPAAPGTRGARGTFVATFDPANERFSFTIAIEGMDEPLFAGHIHKGQRGESGPSVDAALVQNVDPLPAPNGSTSGDKRLSLESILELFSNPTGFYVEVHPVDLTGGIRGQLSRA